jgi:hypothetical protein
MVKIARSAELSTTSFSKSSELKAMLSKGMRNDAIHFYFNRADRLLCSGRIAQIRKNKYGVSVLEATPDELESFRDRLVRTSRNRFWLIEEPYKPGGA